MFKTPEGHMYGAPFCARTRGSRLLPALGVFASVLSWAFSGPASAADPTVRIFSGTDEHWVQFQVAKAKGFFKDEGLDAEVTVFTTGATATEAFRAGRGDFISAGDLPSAAMWKTGAAPRGIIGERRRGMVGTCTAHWTLLTRGMACMVGFLLLLWGGMGNTARRRATFSLAPRCR